MKIGGQTPWNITPMWETSQINFLMGRQTPYERQFGIPFTGLLVPFGAMVEYHPISAKDLSRLHQFGPEVLPGIFLSYGLYAG